MCAGRVSTSLDTNGEGLAIPYGARPLRRAIQHMVEDAVTDMILRDDVDAGDTVLVDVDPEKGLILTRKE